MLRSATRLVFVSFIAFCASAYSFALACQIPACRGATKSHGANCRMTVSKNASCSMANYARLSPKVPAGNFKITKAPMHGTVSFSQNRVIYKPNRGFLGKDSFSYRGSGGDRAIKVRFKVTVK